MYSLRQAAEAVGRGKPAVLKAIKSGKISAHKNDHGEWLIDPAELHRVYPAVSGNGSDSGSSERQETPQETSVLEREIELLRERLTEKDGQIDDFRAERDRLLKVIEEQAGTVKLLTDQRPETDKVARLEGQLAELQSDRAKWIAVMEEQGRRLREYEQTKPKRRGWWPWGRSND